MSYSTYVYDLEVADEVLTMLMNNYSCRVWPKLSEKEKERRRQSFDEFHKALDDLKNDDANAGLEARVALLTFYKIDTMHGSVPDDKNQYLVCVYDVMNDVTNYRIPGCYVHTDPDALHAALREADV